MTSRPYAADDFDAIHEHLKKLKCSSGTSAYDWYVFKYSPVEYNFFALSEKAKIYVKNYVPMQGYWYSGSPTGYTDEKGLKLSWMGEYKDEDWSYSPIHDKRPGE